MRKVQLYLLLFTKSEILDTDAPNLEVREDYIFLFKLYRRGWAEREWEGGQIERLTQAIPQETRTETHSHRHQNWHATFTLSKSRRKDDGGKM